MYQLRVSRGPNDLFLRLSLKHLVNLAKKIEMRLHLLAKFTECFRQVQQVKVPKKDHEDLC